MTGTLAPPQATEQDTPATPFVGLVPYGEGDAAFFFGRDAEKAIITANLRASRLTILYGASGVGKTSVLHAGVVHDLHEQVREIGAGRSERARFAVCAFASWRDDPVSVLAEALRAACSEALGGEQLPPWRPGEPLLEAVRGWSERVRPLLVVLDQFEEYFLYHAGEDGEGTFAVEFPRLVNEPNLRVNFIVALREDAWAKLDRFEDSIPALFDNYVRVEHLDRKAAREAIDGPVREWNRRLPAGEEPYAVEPALAEKVIEAAAAGRLALTEADDSAGPDAAAAGGVEAPFLQLVLERLWRATVEAGAHTLDLARLESLGGAQQIVENHLLEALGKLTPAEQAAAADLFRYLVTRSKTKIAHPATDLAEWTGRPEPEVTAVLDKLCRGESGRILRSVSPPAGETAVSYELFHDVLAEPILDWRRGYEQDRARHLARRRFARIGAVLLTLVAVFGGLTLWALKKSSDADHARRAAAQAASSATSVALASASNDKLATQFDVSLLLSLDAVRARETAQATASMISALVAARRSGAEAILRGHQGSVEAVAFSPDGKTLASAGDHGTVVLWDTQTRGKLGQPLNGHQGSVNAVAFSPDGKTLASAGDHGTVMLWDTQTRRKLGQTLNGNQRAVYAVAFSPDGKTLASAGGDGTVVLWDTQTRGRLGRPLNGNQGSVTGIAFSPDGRTLASVGNDGTVVLWDTQTRGRLGQPLDGHQGAVYAVAFSPDGRTLASAGVYGTVVLWDTQTRGKLGQPLNGHQGAVYAVAFSPDGKTLASAGGALDGSTGTVVIWDTQTHGKLGQPLNGHQGSVYAVAFSPDGKTLASAGGDATVVLWDTQTHGKLGRPLDGHQGSVYAVAFSPDGKTLASAGDRGTVVLWDTQTHGKLGQPLNGHQGSVNAVAFSPDGKTLASAGSYGTVVLWDTQTHGKLGQPLNGQQGSVTAVAFSPDGKTLASAGDHGTVVLWDTQTRRKLGQPLNGNQGPVTGVAFSPDGRTLASAGGALDGSTGTVVIWDTQTHGRLGRPLDGNQGPVYGVAFSPDGKTLASAGDRGTVVLWDTQTRGKLGQPLDGHQGPVAGVAFSPDGKMLASAGGALDGSTGTVVLWDTQTHGKLGQPLDGHQGAVYAVAFSPDGKTLASAGVDGTVVLWQSILWNDDLASLEALVCRLVHGGLTRTEWETVAPGLAYSTTCPD